ncbi:MAG: type II toxin-antitoxin system RelE/ParE family toxin [Acidobacteriaceae bacterium]
MQVVFSSFVESDLDAIAEYIAQDNPTRAVSFLAEIRAKLRAVATHPLLYRLRPEIGEDARVALAGRYVILFRIVGETVRIERIVYGARDLLALFDPE